MSESFVTARLGGTEQKFAIERLAVCRIGRSPHNTIVLYDGAASREHAMIRRAANGACYLSDSGSRNGTTLNGRPVVVPTRLADGDVIRIGLQDLAFSEGERTAPSSDAQVPATMIHTANSFISVLVCDIRGYTTLSRELGEARISALMSDLFREAGGVLFRNHSWSQKFIGDALMGLWVHERPELGAGELGAIIDSIVEMRAIAEDLQRRFALARPLGFGVGINSGMAQVGNMGSGAMSDYTALGDTVNKAFRLETASKEQGVDIVIGRTTLDTLATPLRREDKPPLRAVPLKGYDAPEPCYALSFADLPRLAALVMGAS